jgi:hypothetical protein
VDGVLYKLIYTRDDITGSGMTCGEGAAYDLSTARRLLADGVCRVADDEPNKDELSNSVAAYKRPELNKHWLLPLVTKRWPGWYR